jgi:hypothetical protein
MFDMLDTCWIAIYCISVCLYLFWRFLSRGGRQNRKFFIKKFLMFSHVEWAWLGGTGTWPLYSLGNRRTYYKCGNWAGTGRRGLCSSAMRH